jgi:hypothetical protein
MAVWASVAQDLAVNDRLAVINPTDIENTQNTAHAVYSFNLQLHLPPSHTFRASEII